MTAFVNVNFVLHNIFMQFLPFILGAMFIQIRSEIRIIVLGIIVIIFESTNSTMAEILKVNYRLRP